MKKLFMAALALLAMAIPANGQTDLLPAPANGEFGPHAYVADGLTLRDHLNGDGTNNPHVDGEGAPDVVGAFRFLCGPGQVNSDDPVVYPNKRGRSHAHQFYGNLSTNFASTYETQRTVGLSTCQNSLNRTGYWMPAVISGNQVIRPEYISIYYKREPKTSAACQPGPNRIGICVGIPHALRFIMGYDFLSGTTPTGSTAYKCISGTDNSNRSEFKADLVEAASYCQNGDKLDLLINAPTCWDGQNLDSANHRSHVAYLNDQYKCPSTHPYYFPHFTLQAVYTIDNNLDRSGTWAPGKKTWYLASDLMYTPNRRPGSTFHADYFEGWNDRVKKAWTDNCIDRLLNCSGGDLGNGFGLKQEWNLGLGASPRYVAIPAGAMGPFFSNRVHVHN